MAVDGALEGCEDRRSRDQKRSKWLARRWVLAYRGMSLRSAIIEEVHKQLGHHTVLDSLLPKDTER